MSEKEIIDWLTDIQSQLLEVVVRSSDEMPEIDWCLWYIASMISMLESSSKKNNTTK